MEDKLAELKTILAEVSSLNQVAALLGWDQQTYMPPGGGPARGRQMALLAEIEQEKRIDPEICRLLDALEPWAETLPYESFEAGFIRATRRSFERLVKIPPALVGELSGHMAAAYDAWADHLAGALGVPVWQLLGGKMRDRLRLYWSHCSTTRAGYADLLGVPPPPAVPQSASSLLLTIGRWNMVCEPLRQWKKSARWPSW